LLATPKPWQSRVSSSQDKHAVFTVAHIRDRNRLKGWRPEQTSNAQFKKAESFERECRRPRAEKLKRDASVISLSVIRSQILTQ
jgi:hypothetical protein